MIDTQPPIVQGTLTLPHPSVFVENVEFREAILAMVAACIERAVAEHPERFPQTQRLVLRWEIGEG